jgi:hypothetical protein
VRQHAEALLEVTLDSIHRRQHAEALLEVTLESIHRRQHAEALLEVTLESIHSCIQTVNTAALLFFCIKEEQRTVV